MFKFGLEAITQSISQGTQQLLDPQTRLSIKAKTRLLQETLGSERDISKLPPQYTVLEKKCDSLEKSLRRVLLVTNTFEVDGYDYPPNISESISDWWHNREGWFGAEAEPEPEQEDKAGPGLSLAAALAKSGRDSQHILQAIETKDEDEKEDIGELVAVFKAWSKCYSGIHKSKTEMDQLIAKEFNNKLQKLVKHDFQEIHKLRAEVEDSRLKFDTMRYEVNKDKVNKVEEPESDGKKEQEPAEQEPSKVTKDATTTEPAALPTDQEDDHASNNYDNKLLEQLEDEFVSNTTKAVNVMTEITENSEIIGLITLFQNFQLSYHKHCIEEIEGSLKLLNALEQ